MERARRRFNWHRPNPLGGPTAQRHARGGHLRSTAPRTASPAAGWRSRETVGTSCLWGKICARPEATLCMGNDGNCPVPNIRRHPRCTQHPTPSGTHPLWGCGFGRGRRLHQRPEGILEGCTKPGRASPLSVCRHDQTSPAPASKSFTTTSIKVAGVTQTPVCH